MNPPEGPGRKLPTEEVGLAAEEEGYRIAGLPPAPPPTDPEERRVLKKLVVASLILATSWVAVVVTGQHRSAATVRSAAGSGATAVSLVGDSLAWQADASITSALSHAGYRATVSVDPGHALSSTWAQGELQVALQGQSRGVVVVETASNDAAQAAMGTVPVGQYTPLLDDLLDAARGRCVVLVNAKVIVDPMYYPPVDAQAVNQAIDTAAATHSNVRVVDWNQEAAAHASWFAADSLHLVPGLPSTVSAADPPSAAAQTAADRAFARAVVAGVDSCPGVRARPR